MRLRALLAFSLIPATLSCSDDGSPGPVGDTLVGGNGGTGGSLASGAGAAGGVTNVGAGGTAAGAGPLDDTPNTGGATAGGAPMPGGAATGGLSNGGEEGIDAGGSNAGGAPDDSPHVGDVEDSSASCDVGDAPDTSGDSSMLPDPFMNWDGSRITTKAEWACRRQQIRKELERHIYGTKPDKPEMVTGSVSEDAISIEVTDGGESTSFEVEVSLPSTGQAPYPILISYGGGGFGFSQSGVVQDEGVAVIGYDPYDVGSESASRQSKGGAFYDIYGSNSSAGLLVAWAWGVSRILDVIEAEGGDLFIYNKAAVAGCSRFGKGAFAAGVFDERIALTIPFEAGSGGPAVFKSIADEPGAQSPSSTYTETYWLGDVFDPYRNNTDALPVDMHQALGLIAPRSVLILGNPHIQHLSPNSEYVSALAAAEIWKALGVEDRFSFHSAVSSDAHCSARPEHVDAISQSVRSALFDDGDGPGVLEAGGSVRADLSSWRDWETPQLE